MLQTDSLESLSLKNSWVSIGSFDGVHRGHQEIVRKLTAGAHSKGVPAVVITFYPHPSIVLGKRNGPFYLSTPEERAEQLGKLGVDVVVTHPFNQDVAAMQAREFVERLQRQTGMQKLLVGHDFALGRNREGDVPALRTLGDQLGFTLELMEPVELEGQVISSSQIRQRLREGKVDEAAVLLGRPYSVAGIVVSGSGRGRKIGIPTANLDIWKELLVPKSGVYACRVEAGGRIYPSVTNIGVRPTFEEEGSKPSIETHILDFDEDLYGSRLQMEFWHRLREEQRFSNFQDLVQQIHKDIEHARDLLTSTQEP